MNKYNDNAQKVGYWEERLFNGSIYKGFYIDGYEVGVWRVYDTSDVIHILRKKLFYDSEYNCSNNIPVLGIHLNELRYVHDGLIHHEDLY